MMRLFLNPERTILIFVYDDGRVKVATRPDPDAVWGPPVWLQPQVVD